ncbi:TonB-dependent receptor domain-containing protein [Jiulongibacter sp. NS-SX5]|uniref:TonB-dependent receptor domain-containing protein n=1 Tax=Jiulongibacter sp. NS-SX5 TaxID=3463854 RepID=UPI004058CA12
MKKFLQNTFVLTLLSCATAMAQTGTISGKVIDEGSSDPLAFSTIRIFSTADSVLVEGNITDDLGKFSLNVPYGQYYANVEFIGYDALFTPFFVVNEENTQLDLGELKLSSSTQNLDEVVVQAERSSMELTLDKRVFNVGKDLANAGGSAQQILVNIPSVTVDPDGTIKLRGSNNVRILIDGKPSGLVTFKGGAGLASLQASMVERVEIITNPSARYEAEGMAGIINIILKKESRQGFNGSVQLISGLPANYGAALNLNYRHKKVNFFVNYALTYDKNPYVGDLYQEVYDEGETYLLDQSTEGTVAGLNNNVRGGLDFYFSEKSILTLSYMLSRSDGKRLTENIYNDYLGSFSNPLTRIVRNQDEQETEPLSETVLTWKREFARKGHELNATFRFLDHWENSDQLFTQSGVLANGEVDIPNTFVQHSVNDEFEKQYLFQLDYVQPFAKEGKFEFGARTSLRDMENDYVVNDLDEAGNETPVPGLDNVFLYDENISAVYGIIGNKFDRFSFQAGLRGEWTDVTTTLEKTSEVNPRNYFNFFPSAHLTYDVGNENSLQLSYSRRIRRPVYNDLSPFMTVSDSRNFRSGNPDLNPEYSDVYEIGHLKNFEQGSLTSSVYYRNTTDLIDRIREVDANGFSTTLPQNLNGEQAYGIEFTANYSPYEWWKMDMNFNLFHANIDGSNISEQYQTETNSWFARYTSRFLLPNDLDLQLRANYDAPQNTAQGSRKAIYFFDFALKKDILQRRGTINFAVLDILNSRWMRTINQGETFFTESNRQFRRRQFNLTLSYRINQG